MFQIRSLYHLAISIFDCVCQRAQPEELKKIKKHYETSKEEEVKLLDKPEQSVSHIFNSRPSFYVWESFKPQASWELDCVQNEQRNLQQVFFIFLPFMSFWSRFLYELSQIPDFAGRAHCIIFQSAFIDGIASIQRKLHTVSSTCEVGRRTWLQNKSCISFCALFFFKYLQSIWAWSPFCAWSLKMVFDPGCVSVLRLCWRRPVWSGWWDSCWPWGTTWTEAAGPEARLMASAWRSFLNLRT